MKLYSKFAKVSTLILQTLCVGGFVLSVILAGYVLNSIGSIDDLTEEYRYYATAGCGERLALTISENSAYGKYKEFFETDGSYDPDKTIDIQTIWEQDPNKQNEESTYTVETLRYMCENGVNHAVSSVLSNMWQDDAGEVYLDGEKNPKFDKTYWDHLLNGQTTVSGDTLGQIFENKGSYEWYQYLEKLSHAFSYLETYLGGRNLNTDSNLRFFFRNTETGNVYTNVREWENLTEMPELKNKGQIQASVPVLLSYTRTDGKIEYDWVAENNAQHFLQTFFRDYAVLGDNEQAIIALDVSYSIDDEIKSERDAYETYQPYFKVLVVTAAVCLVLWLIGFVISTIQAGKNERNGEVTLRRFDKVPTELAAILAFALGGCVLAVAVTVPFEIKMGAFLAAFEAVIVVIGYLIFIWAYLSLVRRIKGKTLWSDSILKRLLELCKKLYRTRRRFEKTVLFFAGFAFFHIVMVAVGRGFGIFIVVVCDVLILLYLSREIANGDLVKDGIARLAEGNLDYEIDVTALKGENLELASQINKIGDGMQAAVNKAMKNERMKAELITNVSHDIKTPLTSIINYVDLLKRENLEDSKIRGYIDVLDRKSQRLKHLTEDLIEASKASTGNIELQMSRIDVQQLLRQAYGELEEKLSERGLSTRLNLPEEPVIIWADGKQLWRIFENLLNNISKYAMPNSRVYIDLKADSKQMILTFKNMSEYALNIHADELTERFIRGDESRTTEGSGLGLSIAKNLTELQGGHFEIYLDGDLFKVTLSFERQNVEKTLS